MLSWHPVYMLTFGDSGSNEANYRTAAYQAIAAYLSQATADVLPVVTSTLHIVLSRMEHLLSIHVSRLLLAVCP